MELNALRGLIREAILNAYDILGVGVSATDDDVRRAYKRLSFSKHPDRNPGVDTTADMVRLNAAREVLLDPKKRRALDAFIASDAPSRDDIDAVLTWIKSKRASRNR